MRMTLPAALAGIFRQRNKTYKMVLILSILEEMNPGTGIAEYSKVRERFLSFYQKRESDLLTIDTPIKEMAAWQKATMGSANVILETPLIALQTVIFRSNRLEGEGIGFLPEVWSEMTSDVIDELQRYARHELRTEINKLWATSYLSLSHAFSHVLEHYQEAKTQPRGGHELADLVTNKVPEALSKLPFISDVYKVKGSVGRPSWVKMPWIALMDKRITTTTKTGYYVCYIFSENMDAVYLTLKLSDEPVRELGKEKGRELLNKRVQEMRELLPFTTFVKDDPVEMPISGSDPNYLLGVVAYASYVRDQMPDDEKLFVDLRQMINNYEMIVEHNLGNQALSEGGQELIVEKIEPRKVQSDEIRDALRNIKQYIQSRGFSYPINLIENFYLSLKSKPFVILAGISGTGKTKLVKLFAEAIGATRENRQFTLIPVRPDWSDPSDLLGYKNLQGVFCPGAIVDVFLEANKTENRSKPYFICLDEMNLARVEHYFSDLLSLMETQEWELCDDSEKRIVTGSVISDSLLSNGDEENINHDSAKYKGLHIPENVYFIGTVNMDETTHPFSKKVLDRANTIEFNYINLDNIEGLDMGEEDRPEPLHVHQSFLRSDYLTLQDAIAHKDIIVDTTAKLKTVNQILEQIHAHVGFRIRDAVCFYMIYNQRFNLLSETEAFDIQLCQKILPRIQGSSSSIRKTLIQLLNFADKGSIELGSGRNFDEDDLHDKSTRVGKLVDGATKEDFTDTKYPESSKKIAYMLRRLEEDGFTSFWLS